MTVFTKILVPLYSSLNSEPVLDFARQLFPDEPEIILLEATSNARSSYPAYSADTIRYDQIGGHGKQTAVFDPVSLAIHATSKIAPQVRGYSVFGEPKDAIVKVAKSEAVDLILMVAGGDVDKSHDQLIDAVIQAVSCPVVTVRGGHHPAQFLIALDGTPAAEMILEPALALADLFDADVTLAQLDPDTAVISGRSELYLDDVIRRHRHIASRFDIRVDYGNRRSQPDKSLLNLAEKHSCDLIAVVANGHMQSAAELPHRSDLAMFTLNRQE